jgi:thymidylate synthase
MNSTDQQYIDLVNHVLEHANVHENRTGHNTISTFGHMMKFDMSKGAFPILTTKRVFWKGVVEELLWFLRGDTNSKHLSQKGVRIWDANGSQEFLKSRGLPYQEGDLGPVYGSQWRNWGTSVKDWRAWAPNPDSIDQIKNVIHNIMNDPGLHHRRRLIVSAWNVSEIDKMALPPCHYAMQFYVNQKDNSLNLMWHQRSVDVALGLPFNIASYGLLLTIIAHVTGLKVGELSCSLGDTHIYHDHVIPVKEQVTRVPTSPPSLTMPMVGKGEGFEGFEKLLSCTYADFVLVDYKPHPTIKMTMVT